MFKKFFTHILIFSLFLVPLVVFGQTANNISVKIDNPFNCGGTGSDCTVFTLITSVLNNIIMPIAAVFIVFWIIYAGFRFVVAQGKPAEIEKARQNLLWSMIGAGILLGAAGISQVVQTTVGNLLK